MLGVKSTCKDRWRQVLAEADRIERQHLLTLEAAISSKQTNEMQAKDLPTGRAETASSILHRSATGLADGYGFLYLASAGAAGQ